MLGQVLPPPPACLTPQGRRDWIARGEGAKAHTLRTPL